MSDQLLRSFEDAPFRLPAKDIGWVEDIFSTLDLETKASLVIAGMSLGPDLDLEQLAECPPGFMTRMAGGDAAHEMQQLGALNARIPVPIVYCADLEGSSTTPTGATPSPVPLAMAAANDPELTRRASEAMGREARQFGIRWSFTPAVDLNLNYRSAIIGSRSYGSDIEKVRAHTVATTKGLQAAGVAATAKHWPGEGIDDRDQHLATTVNPQDFDAWDRSFGALYRAQIEAGVMAIMSAHIALPRYMEEVAGVSGPGRYLPGSLNRHLNVDLLRGRLGFNGLIVSDATAMAGISGLRKRPDLVVEVLNAGCDVILGSDDMPADRQSILNAIRAGLLSEARLDEAILRQLAFKAALGVHKTRDVPEVTPEQSAAIAKTVEMAPTLIKTRPGLFPITPERYKTIYLVSRGRIFPPFSPVKPLPFELAGKLRAAGFDVIEHEWGTPVEPSGADLLLFAYAEESLLVRGSIHNDWGAMNGQFLAAMERHWHDLPTLMISFGHPYHLYEAPGVWGYINAYMTHPVMQDAVLSAMTGKTDFQGVSPVDAFAGLDPDYYDL